MLKLHKKSSFIYEFKSLKICYTIFVIRKNDMKKALQSDANQKARAVFYHI